MRPLCSLAALVALAASASGAPSSSSAEGACKCLNWKDVYDSARVVCGEGLELYEIIKPRTNLSLAEASFSWIPLGFQHYEYCTTFFRRMDNNHCVNVAMHPYGTSDWTGEQWCYVSSECTELNGGQPVSQKESYAWALNWLAKLPLPTFLQHPIASGLSALHSPQPVARDLSWKLCTRGQDSRLRDMAPKEVLELARSMDSVIGFVTKIAYDRLLPPEHTWESVKAAVASGDIASMPQALQDAIAAKVPIVIDVDPEGHTHQRIVRGSEVYELEQACTTTACGGAQWPFRRVRDVGEL